MSIAHPRSLFGQIMLVHIVTIAIVALALPMALSSMLRRTATSYQRDLLVRQASALEQRLSVDAAGWHVRPNPTQDALYAAGQDGRAFAVIGADGRPSLSSAHSDPRLFDAAPRQPSTAFFHVGPLRALSRPIRIGAVPAWLIVSQDINDPEVVTDDVVREFLSRFLWLLLPVLALLPFANLALVRRSTQMVRKVSRQAAAIGPASLAVRLPAGALPSEVEPLAIATNNALDRLEQGFRTQSEFVANVAHELRTPLASLRLRLDAITDVDVAKGMNATLDRAAHVISQLLDLASLERLSIDPDERFELVAVARAAVEEAAPGIYAGGRTVELGGDADSLFVCGRPQLIILALANLIDNATRHTPPGTRIEVRVDKDGGVSVEDDGPGIAPASLHSVTQRFWRSDQSRSDSAGIGLSIVERILTAHHAALVVENRRQGGARFRFVLPVA
jgi:signal transduction histidine kinase